ncbi:MAG TPA: two-component system response regulator CreB [Thiobacillus sp.]|nr:two-component system response regulator CreB [Thiobacillus sp.]
MLRDTWKRWLASTTADFSGLPFLCPDTISGDVNSPAIMPAHILLVEDDLPIAENVVMGLEREGFDCSHVMLGSACLEFIRSTAVDLVILDVGLPDVNGFEVCKTIRRTSELPVIFLTARSDEVDRVVGLEIGADDYILKPFSPRELVARVKTILRRSKPELAVQTPASGVFQIDEARACITFAGTALGLTRAEFFLLRTLVNAPQKVFSRQALMDAAGLADASLERVIDTHIKSLRAKLAVVSPELELIRTHRGFGYSLNPPQP